LGLSNPFWTILMGWGEMKNIIKTLHVKEFTHQEDVLQGTHCMHYAMLRWHS
jgi:hypothetical protein